MPKVSNCDARTEILYVKKSTVSKGYRQYYVPRRIFGTAKYIEGYDIFADFDNPLSMSI